jgi:hypothetical protein
MLAIVSTETNSEGVTQRSYPLFFYQNILEVRLPKYSKYNRQFSTKRNMWEAEPPTYFFKTQTGFNKSEAESPIYLFKFYKIN